MDLSSSSEASTRGIRVRVAPQYDGERSDPRRGMWLFAYTIRIANEGVETVQLLARYWHIQNALGQVQEVRGKGVVGEQPVLEPGAEFEYTSQCPLDTPTGSMWGHFLMETAEGERFEAEIPRFELIEPGAIH